MSDSEEYSHASDDELSVTEKVQDDDEDVDFHQMTVPQLREKCRDANVKNYSKLKKAELVQLLIDTHNGSAAPASSRSKSKRKSDLSKEEDESEESSENSSTATGKRKLPWNTKSSRHPSKQARTKSPASTASSSDRSTPAPKKKETDLLELAFSSDEETSLSGPATPLAPTKIVKSPPVHVAPHSTLPSYTPKWNQRKKRVNAHKPVDPFALLLDSPQSDSGDLLDMVRVESSPVTPSVSEAPPQSRSSKKHRRKPVPSLSPIDDDFEMQLSGSSSDQDLPCSPLKKTTHSFVAKRTLDSGSEDDDILDLDTPPRRRNVNAKPRPAKLSSKKPIKISRSPSPSGTVPLDSPTAGTLQLDSPTGTVALDSPTATLQLDSPTATVPLDSPTATVPLGSPTATLQLDSPSATVPLDSPLADTTGTLQLDSDDENPLFVTSPIKVHYSDEETGTLQLDSPEYAATQPLSGEVDETNTQLLGSDDEFAAPIATVKHHTSLTTITPSGTLQLDDESESKEFGFDESSVSLSDPLAPTLSTGDLSKMNQASSAQERRAAFRRKQQERLGTGQSFPFPEASRGILPDSPVAANDNQTLLMDDEDDSDDSMITDTPQALHNITNSKSRKAVAIPFDREVEDNDPLISPTIRLSPFGNNGAFNCSSSPTTWTKPSVMGRLVPVYSSREIISIQVGNTITIGSDSSCTVTYLFDSRLASFHCKIFVQQKKVFVHDLSSNGTFVNQVKIGKGKEVILSLGDELSLTEPNPNAPMITYIFAK